MPVPTTVITQPAAGAVVSGTITVKATATDHSGSSIWFLSFSYVDNDHPMPGSPVYPAPSAPVSSAQLDFDTTILPDGDHLILVKAVNLLSDVGANTTITVNVHNAPPAPINVDATPGDGTLTVHWQPGGGAVNTYRVHRRNPDGLTWTLLATVSNATFSYLDAGLVNGNEYTYYVSALDAAGNESYASLPATAAPHKQPPLLTDFAQTLYDELAPLAYADEGMNYPLAHYCAAIATPFDELWDYVVTPDTPWQTIVDLTVTPAQFVEWLGRFKGVASMRAGLSDAAKRDQIRHAAGFDRGTITSMITAAKANLVGTKHMTAEERVGGSAWQIRFTVYSAEVATSAQRIIDDVSAVKPGGIVFTLVVSASETWNEAGATTWNAAPGGMTWDTATTGI